VRQAIADGLDAVIVNPTGIIGPNDYQPSHFGAVLLSIANRLGMDVIVTDHHTPLQSASF